MVKKKHTSKRITLKDKYKIQKRTKETHRKRKKEAKRDAAKGIVHHSNKSKKDPGIPNSWPFKEELLNDIKRSKESGQERQRALKEKRFTELKLLKDHQEQGGTARTIQELMQQAQRSQDLYNTNNNIQRNNDDDDEEDDEDLESSKRMNRKRIGDGKVKSDGTINGGQSSRRAYLRELKKVIDNADIILQVVDARDPIGSRIHPSMENIILSNVDKRMVIVLNKIDLVPKTVVSKWLTYLRRSHPTIAVKASTQFGVPTSSASSSSSLTDSITEQSTVPVGMDGLLQLLKNYARTGGNGGKSKTTIVVGIIGYPNVGKSSIINALKRSRAVTVSSRPGCTTSMQEVVLDKTVRLLDSPGIVFNDSSALLGNCVDIESVADPIPHVSALLAKCNYPSLLMTYNIPAFPPGDTMAFLGLVAKSYGRVLKGGIPDKIGAARAIVKDWNNGKIPYYTEPPTITTTDATMTDNTSSSSSSLVNNDAVIVSKFSTEFDLSKFDDEIFNNSTDETSAATTARDGMDYIKIEQSTNTTTTTGTATNDDEMMQEAVNYLKNGGDSDDDDDDDAMDDDESDADGSDEEEEKEVQLPPPKVKGGMKSSSNKKKKNQSRLETADDYDFNTM